MRPLFASLVADRRGSEGRRRPGRRRSRDEFAAHGARFAFTATPPDSGTEPRIGSTAAGAGFGLGPARPAEPEEPVEAIPDLVIRPPRQRTSLPAVIELRRGLGLPVKILIVVAVLAVVAAAAGAAYYYRDVILPMLPPGWRTMLHLAP